MIGLKNMKDYNIIQKDFLSLVFTIALIIYLVSSIIIYPLICMFYNSSDIRDEIKGAFKFLFEK